MFLTYDEALGRFKALGSKDPQMVAATAATLRSSPKVIRIAACVFLIPCIAATLLIIGAIVGIPGIIACAIFINKANNTLAHINRAQTDWLASN